MVLNAAVQMLREAEELKQKILKFNSSTSMLQDRSLWSTQQQLQKVYQKVLVLDLDYALEKKVEQDLWNVGFKQQIEALQAISKDRKNALRSEAQAMLSWVLQAAAGFYLCLLHQICTTFKLDLPFRRRASLLGAVEGWEAGGAPEAAGAGAARYACQHCLVHLGDLARYRHQLRVAHTFYRHALAVSVHSGQPYNQLALVAWRRGRRLAALYWHVRSLLVRAPFPPAPANLARTLAAAGRETREAPLPVLAGLCGEAPPPPAVPERLDSHSYVDQLVRTLHYLHSLERLDTAEELVEKLNSSLSHLVAADSFDSMTLVKMACVTMWAVQSATEEVWAEEEARAARLAGALGAAAVLALLLPACSARVPHRAMPALRVWLQWAWCRPEALRTAAWRARPHVWAALARTLNELRDTALHDPVYDTLPLPEDEELHGFLPLEEALKGLKFPNHCGWDPNKVSQEEPEEDTGSGISAAWGASYLALASEAELQTRVRAARLVKLGERIAGQHADHLTCNVDAEGVMTFEASVTSEEQLTAALATLAAPAAPTPPPPPAPPTPHTPPEPATPLVISEADFREKVREKRAGILKPQGSLERAREERRAAPPDEPQDVEVVEEGSKGEDKKEARKPRVNIAMAAIMRKQEETNKQVKFVTPPPTPDSVGEASESYLKDEKPKVIQPKAIKSLANIPVGRKTGGILSLKDKSAGYPHLQNTEPETKKQEKEEKKEEKSVQNSPTSQNYLQRDQGTNWPNIPIQYGENPRMNFQKNYGIQNAGISYNPNYQPSSNGQGIRLPVVNPKEIDVRTAALQKQNSRQEMFQEGNKFNHGYQMTGDKKNFLSDLPPRFANQYRYWQSPQENQFNDNKFREDSVKPNAPFNAQPPRHNWPAQSDNFQQMPWWKPDGRASFNQANFSAPPMNMPNFYSQAPPNMPSPYPNIQFNQLQAQNMSSIGQNKSDNLAPAFGQSAIGQPQVQTLQNLVPSPNFGSPLNSFGPYPPAVSYDSSPYPQFSKLGYQPLQMNKPNFRAKDSDMPLNFGSSVIDMQQHLNYNEAFGNDAANKTLEDMGQGSEAPGAPNTYSLFRQDAHAWPPSTHQSLWSGPGPSPLERLLEQQKQMKPPSTH